MSRLSAIPLLLLPALAFVGLYAPALDHEFVWTDHGEIEQGSLIRPPERWLAAFGEPLHANLDLRLAGLPQSYYRPLHVLLVSAIDAGFGREPRHFRIASLALGAATAALFTALAAALLGSRPAALLAGLVVAVHPVGIEVYAWIAGLSAALAALLVVVSLLAALRAERSAARAAWSLASTAALAAGLLSKESAAVTPALLAALCASQAAPRLAAARSGGEARDAPARGPWPGAGAPHAARTAAILIAAQTLLVALHVLVLRPRVLGAFAVGPPPMGGGLVSHVASAIAVWPQSLAWLFLPLRSSTSDVIPIVRSLFDPRVALGVAAALASAWGAVRLALRGRSIAAFAIAWIWIAYLPTSGLIPLLHARAERNLHLPLLGAALLWPLLGGALRARWPRAPRALAWLLALALVAGTAQRTAARLPDWRSSIALFERDVAADPHYREGRYQLAAALHAAGRDEQARQQLETLIARRGERESFASDVLEPAVYELACVVNERLGRQADSLRLVEQELGGADAVAAMPGLRFCYGLALESRGRWEESLEIYRSLAALGEHPAITVSIARCLARLGRIAESRHALDAIPRETVRDPTLEAAIIQVRRLWRAEPAR